MSERYENINRARSPLKLGALVAFGVIAWIGGMYGAPWIFFVPIALGGGLLAWNIVFGTDQHFIMDEATMRWGTPKTETVVALSDIAKVVIKDWSDSTDFVIQHRDGRLTPIPSNAGPSRPKRFAAALEARGVPVEEK
ncbi:MAG: hypothetical protein AAFQ88_09290 [Pseudomonadota bacterium]